MLRKISTVMAVCTLVVGLPYALNAVPPMASSATCVCCEETCICGTCVCDEHNCSCTRGDSCACVSECCSECCLN